MNEIEEFSLRGDGVYWQPREAKKEMSVQFLVLQPRLERYARIRRVRVPRHPGIAGGGQT